MGYHQKGHIWLHECQIWLQAKQEQTTINKANPHPRLGEGLVVLAQHRDGGLERTDGLQQVLLLRVELSQPIASIRDGRNYMAVQLF